MRTPAHVFKERRQRLFEANGNQPYLIGAGRAPSRNFAANVYPFRASSHFLYLTGLNEPDHWLLMTAEGESLYRTPPSADDVLWHGPGVSPQDLEEKTACPIFPLAALASIIPVETASMPLLDDSSKQCQTQHLGRPWHRNNANDHRLALAMVETRMVHDPAAIDQLRWAAEATMAAHTAARCIIEPGRHAYEVWAMMQSEFTRRGMAAAYGPIITPHGEVLHAHALDTRLEKGDLLLMDVGAETPEGWAGDVTRTWAVGGAASATQRAIHQLVCDARDTAVAMVAPGVEYRDIHLAAGLHLTRGLVDIGILKGEPEGLLERDAHSVFFPHGVGHLLGLDVHDMEDLGDLAGYQTNRERSTRFGLNALRLDRKLEAGMVVTIEPGFYQIPSLLENVEQIGDIEAYIDRPTLAHFADVRGIRIEDDVLVTPGGAEVLTEDLPRDLRS